MSPAGLPAASAPLTLTRHALASQKLQEELNRQDAENAKLKQQNGSLAERLDELEATVKQLAAQK